MLSPFLFSDLGLLLRVTDPCVCLTEGGAELHHQAEQRGKQKKNKTKWSMLLLCYHILYSYMEHSNVAAC